MISQSEAPAPEEIKVHKHRRYLSALSEAMVETYLTGGTRANIMPKKRIPKKKKL